MTKQKKRTRRSDLEFPALDPQYNLKTRYEEIEDLASYAKTLSKEDQAWLNAFSNEEICANFNHGGPKLNDVTDPAVRSRIYGRNNQRNRCITTRTNAQNQMENVDDIDFDNERIVEQEEEKYE